MATTKQATPAVKFYIQSNDPDTMGSQSWQGGIGTIVKSVFAPGMFSKESGKHVLFRYITIREEDGIEHTVRYLRGWFSYKDKEGKKRIGLNMYPSRDGVMIAGPEGKTLEELLEEYSELAAGKGADNTIPSIPEEEQPLYEGVYVVSMEETKAGNVDDKQLLAKIREKTLTDPTDPTSCPFDLNGRSDVLCGMKFQWDRMEQEFSFTPKEGQEKKEFKILLPTHYFGMDEEWEAEDKVNGKTKEKKTTTTKAASDEPEADESESTPNPLEDAVEEKIRSFLVRNKGKQLVKKDLTTYIANVFPADQRKEVLAIAGNNAWLTDTISRPWSYEDGKFSA